jgi:hypothetical protein
MIFHDGLACRRYRLLLVFLCATGLLSDHSAGQEKPAQILVAVGKGGATKPEDLTEVWAIDAKIVNAVNETSSPLSARAFISASTHTDCCEPAVKVSSNCWRCCDSTWLCTDNAWFGALIGKTTKVSEKEWLAAKDKGLNTIPGWLEIDQLLTRNPPLKVSKNDPRFEALAKKMLK